MTKLNRDEILRGILQTLVDGWGHSTVKRALDGLGSTAEVPRQKRAKPADEDKSIKSADLIAELNLSPDRRAILTELAMRFDEGSAFPKLSDVRAFLLSHHRNGADLKGRNSAFKRMLPVLVEMSSKGLERVLARSHHSGPAELSAISDAIKGAGQNLRGGDPSAPETTILPLPEVDKANSELDDTRRSNPESDR